MMKGCVIFLIDSDICEINIFSMTLEKFTQCRVFSFFSLEEAKLYLGLNPDLIIHSDHNSFDTSSFGENVKYFSLANFTENTNQTNKTDMLFNIASTVQNYISNQKNQA